MTLRRLPLLLLLLLAAACDDNNSSSVSADYGSLRVKELALTDAAGKTVVSMTADRSSNGTPRIILRDPQGAVLQTVEIDRQK